MKWSKSKLKCFRECPYRFKLQYIDGIEGEETEVTKKGIILHKLYDVFYRVFDEAKSLIENLHIAKQQIEEIDDEFIQKYTQHIKTFLKLNEDKLREVGKEEFLPLHTEMLIEDEKWVGIIDRVDRVKGQIVLIDYKTTRGEGIGEYFDELCLYAYLFQKHTGIQVNYVGIFYTENGKLVLRKISQKEIEEMVANLDAERVAYELAIKNNNFPKRKGWWCRAYCPYYKICMKEETTPKQQSLKNIRNNL